MYANNVLVTTIKIYLILKRNDCTLSYM